MATNHFSAKSYSIGWVCALQIEMVAAAIALDEEHPCLLQLASDGNVYILRSISEHNVVITSVLVGSYGSYSVAVLATRMSITFLNLKFILLVSIGVGVLANRANQPNVRLSDIVVSMPSGQYRGVVRYDFGKVTANGFVRPMNLMSRPPQVLLAVVANVRIDEEMNRLQLLDILLSMLEKSLHLGFTNLRAQYNRLYVSSYTYNDLGDSKCAVCDVNKLVIQQLQETTLPVVHYSIIALGDMIIKDGLAQDKLVEELGGEILCFKMEAGGLMDNVPCLVIKGICDYADSHRTRRWQKYAAMTAAAYAKLHLKAISPQIVLKVDISDKVLAA